MAHKMMVVDGEIEVCDTCENSLGYPVAWDQAHPKREPGGRAAIVFVILMIAAAIAVPLSGFGQ